MRLAALGGGWAQVDQAERGEPQGASPTAVGQLRRGGRLRPRRGRRGSRGRGGRVRAKRGRCRRPGRGRW
ncbi:hypothetical protein L840_2558, partial [Mycobacterium sp. MAC_011194_8550]